MGKPIVMLNLIQHLLLPVRVNTLQYLIQPTSMLIVYYMHCLILDCVNRRLRVRPAMTRKLIVMLNLIQYLRLPVTVNTL